MKNQEFLDALVMYRAIHDSDKINLSNFFEYYDIDDSFQLDDRTLIVKHKNEHYECSFLTKTFLERNFSFAFYDYGLSVVSDSDFEYSAIAFNRITDEAPLVFNCFHYSYCDESGYYSYILKNNMLYFRYLGVDRKDSVPFEKWKYNYEVNEEGKMKEIVPDIDVSLSLGNMAKVIYDIYQDPKIGFRFMKEVNTQ